MEMNEFAARASETDYTADPDCGLQIVLHGIAGEAGSVVSEAKKWFREGRPPAGLAERVEEELGDLLWYLAATANRLSLELDTIAAKSLKKAALNFADELPPPSTYDAGWPDFERLPRRMLVRFVEDDSGPVPVVRMQPLGELAERIEGQRAVKYLGDPLDDNLTTNDSYRYHDVIHLAHAAVLGWSPVLRGLMGAKRKSGGGETDRTQDGARAVAIEEGLAAFVFNSLEPDDFEATDELINWDLIKHVRRTVRDLEVEDQPPVAWRHTYKLAFSAFRSLRDARGGVVELNLDAQTLTVRTV